MIYTVDIRKSARKDIRALDEASQRRVFEAIDALAESPRPPGARKLQQRTGWRIRVGVIRIIYLIDDVNQVVKVVRAGHRRDVYRRTD